MDEPGQKLKKRREELKLRYRDVEELSERIATLHKNDEYMIAISRLADIENKGISPSIYRLYALAAIYRIDLTDILEWYGVDVNRLPGDSASLGAGQTTHLIKFSGQGSGGEALLPIALDPGIDLKRTTYLSRMIQRWGKLPLMLLNSMDLKGHRYAYVGAEDWSMHPLIAPGSLILIDETKRKIASTGWTNEFDRPIYFFERRDGYTLGWATLQDGILLVIPHPASESVPEIFSYPSEIDIVGQVVGVAMRLDPARRRRNRA
jgi:transcriptional regulator with XRE-family HTH domain